MIALEVIHNGKPVVVAGIDEEGSLSAMLSVISSPAGKSAHYIVGGLVGAATNLEWVSKGLELNDCIKINIIETEKIDEPIRKEPPPKPDPSQPRNLKIVK